MKFNKKLEGMLEAIGHKADGEVHKIRESSEYWGWNLRDEYFDKILETLFDKDYEFDETRESQIRRTSGEMISNSEGSCGRTESLYIEHIVYFGTKGIVIHIIDDGKGFDSQKQLKMVSQIPVENQAPDEKILTYDPNYVLPGNTGSFCLLRYSNDFQYSEKGNEVAIQFDISRD